MSNSQINGLIHLEKFISHPLIKENVVQSRLYQEVLTAKIIDKGNSLVVAPTALGKTLVAVMLSAYLLKNDSKKKILFLAPTKPLAVQHENTFRKFMTIPEDKITLLTGTTNAKERIAMWDNATIVNATPQTIENDVLNRRITLDDVALCIFDEAHRAVKDYSYVYIARKYQLQAKDPLILGLTASPGSTDEKIQEVCKNLFIKNIEIKRACDADVKPYTNEIEMEWVRVNLPNEFTEIQKHLNSFMSKQLIALKKFGLVKTSDLRYYNKVRLLEMQSRIRRQLSSAPQTQPSLFAAISKIAALLKVSHALILLETQGIYALKDYFDRMEGKVGKAGSPKALNVVMNDEGIKKSIELTKELYAKKVNHPKIEALGKILKRQFTLHPESKVIIFNQYRDSIKTIVEYLEGFENVKPKRFIGQATKVNDKGMTQKEQTNAIEDLKDGTYNVLVASSVAEEGLDIPSVDLVIFYEPVPSEIRTIQRRGRTGRLKKGKAIILMARGTRDEAYYWASNAKEKRMHKTLGFLKDDLAGQQRKSDAQKTETRKTDTSGQTTLSKFDSENMDKVIIYADSREQNSSVLRELEERGCYIKTKQLDVGDYVLTNDIVVERKTIDDFLSSMLDGRLFNQMIKMTETYDMPLILVEGDKNEMFSLRNVHRNAIIGAMTSIALNYRVPILFTDNAKETAEYLYVTAKREQLGKGKDIRLRTGRKGLTQSEMQQFIVESFPLTGPNTAKAMLKHFGSVKNIVDADVKALQEVDNIGDKKAKKIRKILDSGYKEK
ncbi:MAG: DEAD/DEAH box helicase [Candidatus Diapherotrites archaeon]